MHHRQLTVFAMAMVLLSWAACINDPNANLGSNHPDKALFDRAMYAMEGERFDVARMTLQTLLNTYPDSEYSDRATQALQDPRLAICDGAWMTPAPDFTVRCPDGDATTRSLPE